MTWKHPDSPVPKQFKTRPSTGKLMLTVFWDSRGPILEHYAERRSTATNDRYWEMLRQSSASYQALSAVDYCHEALSYCTTMHVLIRRLKPWKLFKSCVLRFQNITVITGFFRSRPRSFRFSPLRTLTRSFARTSVFQQMKR